MSSATWSNHSWVGDVVEPRVELAVVEQFRLVVEELLDLAFDE